MSFIPFLKKRNKELPDNYAIKILYVNDSIEEFELASHFMDNGLFEFVTKENKVNWIPLTSVKRIEFDSRFSKVLEIKEKQKIKGEI